MQVSVGSPISKMADRSLLSDLEYAGGSPVRMYINPAQFLHASVSVEAERTCFTRRQSPQVRILPLVPFYGSMTEPGYCGNLLNCSQPHKGCRGSNPLTSAILYHCSRIGIGVALRMLNLQVQVLSVIPNNFICCVSQSVRR